MAKAVEELKSKRNLFCIMYGKPCMKKTTMAMSAKRVLLIDTENGLPRVDGKYRKGFFAQPQTWEELIAELDPKNPDCVLSVVDTISIDTIGGLFNLAKEWNVRTDPKSVQGDGVTLAMRTYGKIAKMIVDLLMSILRVKNLVIVGHSTEGKDGEDLRFKIAVDGQTKDLIWRFADIGCFVDSRGKDIFYCFKASNRYDSKRIGNIADEYKFGDEDCDIGKWFDVINNTSAENDVIAKKYDEIILNARAIIDEVKTADNANDAIGSLKALEVVGESKTVAWLMLKRHCASIGLEMKDGKFTVKG